MTVVALLLLLVVAPLAAQTPPRDGSPPRPASAQDPVNGPPGVRPQTARTPPPPPPAPFRLSPQQQALLDQILELWEKESDKIQTFRCNFERWEYDPVFLQDGDRIPVTKSSGQLKYAKPDKGLFRITKIRRYVAKAGDWEASDEAGEHWVCDGTAIYEFNAIKRQLIVRELPPELRGKAIADGPLPFLFSADAKKLKRRYFIRVTDTTESEIWLEAYPRYRRDAANFQKVELILDRRRFLPSALQVFLPNGKSRTVYMFQPEDARVNDPLERFIGVFQQPRAPYGWKRIVEPAPARQTKQAASPGRHHQAR